MKSNKAQIETIENAIFQTGTSLSDPNPWFVSLIRQFRQNRADRRKPLPRVEITAVPDPAALDRLVNRPNQIVSLISEVREAIQDRIHPHHTETTATPVVVQDLWQKRQNRIPEVLSVLLHVGVVLMLITITVNSYVKPKIFIEGSVLLEPLTVSLPTSVTLPPAHTKPGGGGGGGMRALTPASKGVLPRASDRQFVPPTPVVVNMAPELVMEPTIIAPVLANLPRDLTGLLPMGDPNGVVGPPSAGPGSGGGIGDGTGHGAGSGNGPGFGPGSGGGYGGGAYHPGGALEGPYRIGGVGGLTAPNCTVRTEPSYSDDARKAHIQGTVVLDSIIEKDGSISVNGVSRSLGYGLDAAAREALRSWKCYPGKLNGQPVAVQLQIVINFHLY
jgi:periplasmic protein TonB